MLDLENVLGLQGTLFSMMFLGWIAGRKGIISRESRKGLSDILIYIVSPCNIMEDRKSTRLNSSHWS